MADELSAIKADLYRLPLNEFTAARDKLAKELRRETKRAQAEEVKALRKPTATAWLVNQLSHQAKADVKRLLAAGARMRKARTAPALRKASAAEREAIAKLGQRAEAIAGSLSAATSERLRETLHAAAGDAEVGELVASGRLEKEQRLVGLGGPPLVPDARAATRRPDEDRRRERDAAKQRLQQAEREHGRALAAAERAQAELNRAAAELRNAKEDLRARG